MALTGFSLTPSDGLKNAVSFPTSPASEAAARKQIQDVIDQVVADGNTLKDELSGSGGAAEIGCTGATANIQAFIDATEAAGSGTTPGNDVITNAMMVSDVKIGSLAALIATITGTNRDNVVAAINFVVGLLGTYSLLTTTEKGNLVAAINEVNAKTASVLTTLGDIIVRGASDAQRLAIGTAFQSLNVNSAGNGLQYQASLQSLITAAGDLIYGSGANTPARLALTANALLKSNGTVPTWLPFDATANKAVISNGSDIAFGYSASARYNASDNVLATANTERNTQGAILKRFTPMRKGNVRVKGQFRNTGGNPAQITIRNNAGTTISGSASTTSNSYVGFNFDTGDIELGDTFSVYCACGDGGGMYIRNVTFCATESGYVNSVQD